MYLREMGLENLGQGRGWSQAAVNAVMNLSGYIKYREYLEWLNKVVSNPVSYLLLSSCGDINFNPGV